MSAGADSARGEASASHAPSRPALSSWFGRLRDHQIAGTVRAFGALQRIGPCRRLIDRTSRRPLGRRAFAVFLGPYRLHGDLAEAEAAIAPYAQAGHAHPDNVRLHLGLNAAPRPSDYAALFHIARTLPAPRRIFDLGGNAGNLFYCYRERLNLPADCRWIVHDLPPVMAAGVTLARERGAAHLCFSADLGDAAGADLLIASGSAHYLPQPLDAYLATLEPKPRYILINRMPLTSRKSVAVIQDGGSFKVACMLYNRDNLVGAIERLGYSLDDSWQAAELSLPLPGYPAYELPSYTGLWFRRVEVRSVTSKSVGNP